MTKASYRKFKYAIAAGATQHVSRSGDFFHVVSANGDFKVGWDNLAQTPFFAGLEYEIKDGSSFASAQVTNTGSEVLDIEFGIGMGGIRDGRLTVSATLDVADNGGASFDEVVTATAAVAPQIENDSWLYFSGYVHKSSNSTMTWVTAAENVNGVDILYVNLSTTSNGRAYFLIDSVAVFTSLGGQSTSMQKIRVPAGVSISVEEQDDYLIGNIHYKLL